MANKKPYYDLAGALWMAKNHGLIFRYSLGEYGKYEETSGDFLSIVDFIADYSDHESVINTKFFVANPEVLEPRNGDLNRYDGYFDGHRKGWLVWNSGTKRELLEPKNREIDFRNGIAFISPKYDEKEKEL